MSNINSYRQPRAFGRKKPAVKNTSEMGESFGAEKMTLAPLQQKSYLERRKYFERIKQLKKVQIVFNNGCTIDAILRDISENGAQIEVQNPQEVPNKFTLKLTSDYVNQPCQIAWRDEKSIGLQFVSL